MFDSNQFPDKQRGAEYSAPLWLFAPAGRASVRSRPSPRAVLLGSCLFLAQALHVCRRFPRIRVEALDVLRVEFKLPRKVESVVGAPVQLFVHAVLENGPC